MQLAKSEHMDRLDSFCSSRERLVMLTSLWRDDVVLEPNMFPCKFIIIITTILGRILHLLTHLRPPALLVDATPAGREHYTRWSVQDLSHEEVRVDLRSAEGD